MLADVVAVDEELVAGIGIGYSFEATIFEIVASVFWRS